MDASANPAQALQKAAVCSICLEFFQDPVSIECGHNFCRACIAQCCEVARRRFCCPHCRRKACKSDFRPNRELAHMVELAKRFKFQEEEEAEARNTEEKTSECEKHQEPLKLFCDDDQVLICVVCDRSKEHRSHNVLPLEEAVLDYKEQIQNQLQTLKQERERLQDLKQANERTVKEYLENLDTERKKMSSEFERLHRFLEEMEQILLDQLDELEMEVRKGQNGSDIPLSEEISALGGLISEMEEKCKQSDGKFLQNIKEILGRSKKEELHLPMEISQDLKEKLSTFDKKNISLEKSLKKFKESLRFELQEKEEAASLTIGVQTDGEYLRWQKDEILPDCVSTLNSIPVENMTLDLDTAGPYLILSDNRKSMRIGDMRQKRARSRDRFDIYPCVLGCRGFSSGKHCWEIEVVEGGCWAVGAARESVKRKKKLSFRPEEGIWALEHLGFNYYRALTSPPTPLPLSKVHRKVQVCLDYEGGQIAFVDAEKDTWIFTFSSVSFGGEKIYPWLWVGRGSQLRLCP